MKSAVLTSCPCLCVVPPSCAGTEVQSWGQQPVWAHVGREDKGGDICPEEGQSGCCHTLSPFPKRWHGSLGDIQVERVWSGREERGCLRSLLCLEGASAVAGSKASGNTDSRKAWTCPATPLSWHKMKGKCVQNKREEFLERERTTARKSNCH